MKSYSFPVWAWICLILFFSAFYPRMLSLGGFPKMDEGYYAWQAMHMHAFLAHGWVLPPDGTLALYPLLVSWLCHLPGSPIIWFRIADLLAALTAGCLYCRLIMKLGNGKKALVFAFIFLCAMNLPPVIDDGFKNSIFIAFIPLFTACLLAMRPDGDIPWAGIGMLVAAGVLLRETLAIFALLGFFAIWIGWGWKAALFYTVGGLLTGICVFIAVGVARGDMLSLPCSYLKSGGVYADQTDRVFKNFMHNGLKALEIFCGPMFLVLYGFFMAMKNHTLFSGAGASSKQPAAKTCLFWACAAFLPVLEPASKLGFVYHFAICLPGLGILCAYAWRNFNFSFSGIWGKCAMAILAFAIIQICWQMPSTSGIQQTWDALENSARDAWSARDARTSNGVLVERELKKILKPDDTLAVSGFTHFFYGINGNLPPQCGYFEPDDAYRLSDLARSFRALGRNPDRLAYALRMNPPDVLVLAYAVDEHEPDYYKQVVEAVDKSGLYQEMANIGPDRKKEYGWLGFTVFEKKGRQKTD